MKFAKFFILFTFLSWPLFATNRVPEEITIFKQGCSPQTDCKTNFQGMEKDFTLRWKSYKKGLRSFLELQIEGDIFHISISPFTISSDPFPFDLFIFSDSIKLYGSLHGGGSGGIFINYFLRNKKGRFHYLGRTPFLIYNDKTGYFIGGEKLSASEHITSYYKLEGTSLVLKKTVNSLDQEI